MGKKTRKAQKKREAVKKQPTQGETSAVIPKIPFWQKLIPPVLLSAITTAFYYPSLRYPFQFDDLANITKKFDIRFSDPLSGWWRNRRWMGEWLNRLNFEWGRFDPYYYRLTNMIVHILAGVVVFFLILEGCAYLKKRAFFARNALTLATATSALFLLHPVQTQAVSYVIQARLEGLATLFVLTTLLLMLKAFQTRFVILKYLLIVCCLGIGFLSCGTKEIAIVSPFLALLLDWFFIAEERWDSFKTRLWFHGLFSFVILATFAHYLGSGFFSKAAQLKHVTGNNRGNVLTNTATDKITALHFLISEFKVILHYLVVFLWPFRMSVEYDWKLSESFFSPDSFFPFLALCVIFSLAAYTLIKKKHSFAGFGLMWFFISIAPRSTIIPSPELICDYKTYLSSVGWLFVIATSFIYCFDYVISTVNKVAKQPYKPLPQVAALLFIALPIGWSTMNRNIVWSSPVEFWGDIVKKAPLKARGYNNLGVALSEANKFDESIPLYLQAIRLDRQYSDPWSNLAVAYSVKGEVDKAIGALKQAIRILPNYPEAYNNLGTLMIKKKNYEAAEKILYTALKLRPYYGKAFYNLGRLYMDKGDLEKSWESFKKATEGDLDTIEGFYTYGQMSLKLKKYDHAVHAFSKALQRGQGKMTGPKQNQIVFNLANSYFMDKKYDQAIPIFEKLIAQNPRDHRYRYNLGEAYYTKKDYISATKVFKQLTEPPFSIAQAGFRYANCLEKLNKLSEAKDLLQKLTTTKNLPEEMKKMAVNEIGRLSLQERINRGNCTLTAQDLKNAFGGKRS